MSRSNLAIDREWLRAEIFQDYLANPPKNDDELHWWIKTFLGMDIPRTASGVCPDDHTAPFDFIADQFFERCSAAFGFANRNGGKTILVAVLNVLDMLFKPGIEIVLAGAVLQQAQKGYEYLIKFLTGDPLLASMVAFQPTMSKTVLRNESKIIIVTCTYAGLNGPHPNKLRLDEVELIHPQYLQEGLSMPQSHPDGWSAQVTFTSTRKISAGTVQKLIDQAEEKDIRIYKWCVFENIERCTRKCKADPEHGDCGAYSKPDKDGKPVGVCGVLDGASVAHGKAQKTLGSNFYRISDFIGKVAILDRQTWNTQWVNEKPSGGALVYGEYYKDEPPYVVTTEQAMKLLERARAEQWQRVVGIDFGSNFYVGYFMQDPLEAPWGWYGYYELYWTPDHDLPLRLRAQQIRQMDPLGWSDRTLVFADPAGKQQIIDLADFDSMGGYPIEAQPAVNDVFAGINYLKGLFEYRSPAGRPGLQLFSVMKELRKEFGESYVHPSKKDGDVDRDKILKANDHGADGARYALFSVATMIGGGYTTRALRFAGGEG